MGRQRREPGPEVSGSTEAGVSGLSYLRNGVCIGWKQADSVPPLAVLNRANAGGNAVKHTEARPDVR